MYQNAHKKTLDEGYDYLLTFEHDMLTMDCCDRCSRGLYQLRHGARCVNAFTHIDDRPNLGKSFTQKKEWFIAAFKKDCQGVRCWKGLCWTSEVGQPTKIMLLIGALPLTVLKNRSALMLWTHRGERRDFMARRRAM